MVPFARLTRVDWAVQELWVEALVRTGVRSGREKGGREGGWWVLLQRGVGCAQATAAFPADISVCSDAKKYARSSSLSYPLPSQIKIQVHQPRQPRLRLRLRRQRQKLPRQIQTWRDWEIQTLQKYGGDAALFDWMYGVADDGGALFRRRVFVAGCGWVRGEGKEGGREKWGEIQC